MFSWLVVHDNLEKNCTVKHMIKKPLLGVFLHLTSSIPIKSAFHISHLLLDSENINYISLDYIF
jgi:hypothetical protein